MPLTPVETLEAHQRNKGLGFSDDLLLQMIYRLDAMAGQQQSAPAESSSPFMSPAPASIGGDVYRRVIAQNLEPKTATPLVRYPTEGDSLQTPFDRVWVINMESDIVYVQLDEAASPNAFDAVLTGLWETQLIDHRATDHVSAYSDATTAKIRFIGEARVV